MYYITWSNIQTYLPLTECGQGFTANKGDAISQGFDLQLGWVIADGLNVHALAGYSDAYYPKAFYGAPSQNGSVPILNAAGDKLPGNVPWTFAVIGDYSKDVSALWSDSRAYVRADFKYVGKATSVDPVVNYYSPTQDNHPDPAYGVLNLRLGVVHGGLNLSVYVNNTLNADPQLGYENYNQVIFSSIPPLTAGFTAWYRY